MSRDSEKTLKEIKKFLEENTDENMSMDDVNDMIQDFMEKYNNLPQEITATTAKTSDDYLELADNAKSKTQALKYAKKAVELDPDNIDAKRIIEETTAKQPYEMIEKYQKLIEQGKEIMYRKGYMDSESIGNYWGIIETRPFIRLYRNYLELLLNCGMMRMATAVGEEIIRYNNNDNLGVRYILMHIYAYLEDEKSLMKLYKKYDKHDDTQMLLPVSILYYKSGNFKKSEEFLKRLAKVNKDTGIFIQAFLNNSLDEYFDRMNSMGYRPFTIEEFLVELEENAFLFDAIPFYFKWAVQVLKATKLQ